jgi:hypothetical protein
VAKSEITLLKHVGQRLTSHSAALWEERVEVRCRRRAIDTLVSLDHPDGLSEASAVASEWISAVADYDEVAEVKRRLRAIGTRSAWIRRPPTRPAATGIRPDELGDAYNVNCF